MKRSLLILCLLLSASLVLWLLLPVVPPKYHGRPVTVWQDEWAAKKSGEWREALQHLGTNALPYAVRNLALNDSSWRKTYAQQQSKLPALLQLVFRKPKPLLQVVDGANVFYYLGSNSIPHAIALLQHDSPTVRRAAAWGLCGLRRQSPAAAQAIPALIGALGDPDRGVRSHAALSLQEMGAAASNAVPALTKVVACTGTGPETNSLFYLRAAAAKTLGKIGPTATNALPVLQAALHESNAYLRGQSAVAIWRISADVDSALPVLLREMPGTDQNNKWDWIIALGEMGPRAKAAVPQLRAELQKDSMDWVLDCVTNALKRIDPQAAAEAGVK